MRGIPLEHLRWVCAIALGLALCRAETAEAGPKSPGASEKSAKKKRKKRRQPKKQESDEEAAPKPDPPWAVGVPEDRRQRADALLEEGNALFVDEKFVQAMAKYREALVAWDHPTIRFNLARTLISLERPLEALDNFERSLRYGKEALGETIYREATGYRQLLASQVGVLQLRCTQEGARVSVDGDEVLRCPGEFETRVMPGKIQVVAEKEDYLAFTREVFVSPGQREEVSIELIKASDAVAFERRWSAWKPWATVVAGAVVGGAGGFLVWKSRRDHNAYNRELAEVCPEGCPPSEIPPSLRRTKRLAEIENPIGISATAVGGATLVTGLVLVLMNRPRPVEKSSSPLPAIGPTISSRSLGAEVRWRF